MAIIPSTKYTGQIDTSDPTGYPYGKAKNVVTAGDGTGTPLEKDWVNDWLGFVQAMLDRDGTAPTGTPEKVGTSQLLDALDTRFGTTGNFVVTSSDMMSGAWTPHRLYLAELSTIYDAVVANNGTRMYAVNSTTEEIRQYNLTTAYDQSTASYQDQFTLPEFGASEVEGITINPDGDKILVCGREASPVQVLVQQINLSTDWDLTTASAGTLWAPSGMHSADVLNAVRWNGDGTKLLVLGRATGNTTTEIQAYTTTTAYSLSGIGAELSQLDVTDMGSGSEGRSFDITDDGTRLFVVDEAGEMFDYRLSTADDLTTASIMPRTRTVSPYVAFHNISFAVGNEARTYMVASNNITSMYSSAVRAL